MHKDKKNDRYIISFKNVTKIFKTRKREKSWFSREYEMKKAVDNISFFVRKGEFVGLLGANGGGKSTTVKMLSGILSPTEGEIRVNGIIPYKQRKQNSYNIGAMFGQRSQLWWDLPLIETFKILRHIYRLSDDEFRKNFEILCDVLELRRILNVPVRELSLGQRVKADFAAAVIHFPPIFYLDEPFVGIDTLCRMKLREFLKTINIERKTTIILVTHNVKEIEGLCSRVFLLDKGRIVYDGDVFDLKKKCENYKTLIVEFRNPEKVSNLLLPGASLVKRDDNKFWFRFKGEVPVEIVNFIVDSQISNFTITEDIEEIVASIYKDLEEKNGQSF